MTETTPPPVDQAGGPSPVRSLPNLRDLGGWRAIDGAVVGGGVLFRSADFGGFAADDLDAYAALGIRTVYDFRSAGEREATPDPSFPGVADVGLDVLGDSLTAVPANLGAFFSDPAAVAKATEHLSGGGAAKAITATYRDLVTLDSARRGYARFFDGLADPAGGPSLFHCTAGRTAPGGRPQPSSP